jgi:hypothetical protein
LSILRGAAKGRAGKDRTKCMYQPPIDSWVSYVRFTAAYSSNPPQFNKLEFMVDGGKLSVLLKQNFK